MDSLYSEISEFFSFDKQKYTIEEFFSDVKTFKDDFMVSKIGRKIGWSLTRVHILLQHAQKEIIKLREGEEKQRRAREAREKAEAEKAARAARKRALVDMNAHETQEGVMDSLMEALQTGSAFSRPDQRRKRQTRAAGGKFYRSAYASTKSTKKENASLLARNQLYESGEAERAAPPNRNIKTTAAFLLRDPAITSLASSVFTRYTTPEENQRLYKRSLLDLAMRAPKRGKFLSRVSSFNKNRQMEIRYKKIRVDRPMIEETPKRQVSVKRSRNFDKISTNSSADSVQRVAVSSSMNTVVSTSTSTSSYGPVIDELERRTRSTRVETRGSNSELFSPTLCRTILVGKALMISPVKRRRVIVGKKHKRNSIVRRAVERRRSRHRRSAIGGERIGKSFGYFGSPTSESVSLIENDSAACCTYDSTDTLLSNRISKSMGDIARSRIGKTISSPVTLIRMKNLDSVARWKDVNENDLSVQYSNGEFTIFKHSVRSETASGRATELNELAVPMSCQHNNSIVESEMCNNRNIFRRLRFSNNALKFYSMFARRKVTALNLSAERDSNAVDRNRKQANRSNEQKISETNLAIFVGT
ncbi:unnamed protein product [Heterotrigona itama]|uniref:DAD domain-containing protein n=1 Tax=Heterotrigona itama TaxID=395501 RepID=A0A6V7HD03_9HYME|nr:unnamed protein product [Heterotrigona itama]